MLDMGSSMSFHSNLVEDEVFTIGSFGCFSTYFGCCEQAPNVNTRQLRRPKYSGTAFGVCKQ